MSLVLDTGPLVALLNAGDPNHARCADLLAATREDLVIPSPVMVEVEYWCCCKTRVLASGQRPSQGVARDTMTHRCHRSVAHPPPSRG